MDDPEIAVIVGKLSEAQRAALAGPARQIGNPAVTILTGKIYTARRMAPTMAVLRRLGLIESGRFGPTSLTPLGLRVREALTNPQPEKSNDR